MQYDLIIELIQLVEKFDRESENKDLSVYSFAQWLNEYLTSQGHSNIPEPDWQGKSNGRSADSVINTSLVHLYRYAKLQAKSAILDTKFSTPDDFIYLICLDSFGSMTKTALIKLNVHEKSAGMQIVKRLIDSGFIEQTATGSDKRNRFLHITPEGSRQLSESMDNIRQASRNVTEPLSKQEKHDLIRLLTKLEKFHETKMRG